MTSEMPIIQRREPEPQSISHWGMIELPMPPLMIVPKDFEFDERDLLQPGYIVWQTPRPKYDGPTIKFSGDIREVIKEV